MLTITSGWSLNVNPLLDEEAIVERGEGLREIKRDCDEDLGVLVRVLSFNDWIESEIRVSEIGGEVWHCMRGSE